MEKKRAKTTYVLIDYENVQPKDFAILTAHPFQVKIFVGPKQAKIPLAMARAIQTLGKRAEYVHLKKGGPEALDLLIAYHIGEISSQEQSAAFYVISKDKGYEPLFEYLKEKGLSICRAESIEGISISKPAPPPKAGDLVETAIQHLAGLKAAKPRTEKKLRSSLHARFNKQLSEKELSALIDDLGRRDFIKVVTGKLSYPLHDGR